MTDVLVPLDGSPLSEQALPLAGLLARTFGSQIRLLQAIPPTIVPAEAMVPIEPFLDEANQYLENIARKLEQEYGAKASGEARYGLAVDSILDAAEQPEVAQIVMSTHGRTGLERALMGSVAESVLRQSPVPVFLVPAAAQAEPKELRRILVPLDGSEFAHTVVEPAAALARALGGELLLVEIAPEPQEAIGEDQQIHLTADEMAARSRELASEYLRGVHDELIAQGVPSEIIVRFGAPAKGILQVAAERQVDAIAISTHGRTGLDRLRHGSVAEDVIRHSTVPVMTLGRETIQRRTGSAS